MIRLLIVAAATYAAYRFTKKVIDDVPDNFDPLPMPGDERRALRRQSAAGATAIGYSQSPLS